MSLDINIEVTDGATPVLRRLLGKLTDRTGLHAALATVAEQDTRAYLRGIAKITHKTSARLKAAPSGYLTKAAEAVESRYDATQTVVTVHGEIFKRVMGPVTVKPREKKYLTLPATAEAYNHRAGEFKDLFFVLTKKGTAFLAKKDGDKLKIYYWLKTSVVLPQDRQLLPSDQAWAATAEAGADAYLDEVREKLGL